MSEIRRFWKRKQNAYRLTFGDPHEQGKIVLTDLRTFCFATKTGFSKDPLEMARNEGRREVFYRIMDFLKIDYDETYNMEEENFDD